MLFPLYQWMLYVWRIQVLFLFYDNFQTWKAKKECGFPCFHRISAENSGDRILIASIKVSDGHFQLSKKNKDFLKFSLTYISDTHIQECVLSLGAAFPLSSFWWRDSSMNLALRILKAGLWQELSGSARQGGRAAERHIIWEVRVCDCMDRWILPRGAVLEWTDGSLSGGQGTSAGVCVAWTMNGILKGVSWKRICIEGCKNPTNGIQEKTCLNRVNSSYFRGMAVTVTAPLLRASSRMREEEWRRGGRKEQAEPSTPFLSLVSVRA